jgi:hypothetical protein
MLLPTVLSPELSVPTTVTSYCNNSGSSRESAAPGSPAVRKPTHCRRTLVPGFKPVKMPVTILLVKRSGGQVAHPTSLTVKSYCRQMGDAGSQDQCHTPGQLAGPATGGDHTYAMVPCAAASLLPHKHRAAHLDKRPAVWVGIRCGGA